MSINEPIKNNPEYDAEREFYAVDITRPDGTVELFSWQIRPGTKIAIRFPGGGVFAHEFGTVVLVPYWMSETIENMGEDKDRVCFSSRKVDGKSCELINKELEELAQASYELWPQGEFSRQKKEESDGKS